MGAKRKNSENWTFWLFRFMADFIQHFVILWPILPRFSSHNQYTAALLAFCRCSAKIANFSLFLVHFLAFLEDMTILSNFGQNLLNIFTIQEKGVNKIGFF